ncbi:unnamed protein product, partial [Allacma fusca]
ARYVHEAKNVIEGRCTRFLADYT